jgi:hypothetical protein
MSCWIARFVGRAAGHIFTIVTLDDEGGWLSKAIWGSLRHFAAVRDNQRMQRIEAGADVDDHDLPLGTIPAEFVDSREEARLVYPNAQEVFRKTGRGPGSMLIRIISFDNVPAATALACYIATATPTSVLDWYRATLEARGWQSRIRRPAEDSWDAVQVFYRTRESLSVTVPTASQAQHTLEHLGISWPLRPDQTYFTVDYRILVEPPNA